MSGLTFGVAVTCIDGRVQRPITYWIRERYGLDYVDIVSEPGPDKLLAEGWPSDVVSIKNKVAFSVTHHRSGLIAISGHHDCAGNPATPEEHLAQIRRAMRLIRSWGLPAEVIGLWVNEHWEIEPVEEPAASRPSFAADRR